MPFQWLIFSLLFQNHQITSISGNVDRFWSIPTQFEANSGGWVGSGRVGDGRESRRTLAAHPVLSYPICTHSSTWHHLLAGNGIGSSALDGHE